MFINFPNVKRILSGLSALAFVLIHHAAIAANDKNTFTNVQQLGAHMLVDAVLLHNPDIPALQAAWNAAKARIEQVDALDDPLITYSVAPRTAGDPVDDLRHSISVSQGIPWPGKLALRGDISRLQAQASFENIEGKRLELTLLSKQLFAQWYFIHAALRINNINKSLFKEFRDIAEIKYAAGRVTKQDVLLADTKYVLLEQRDVILQRQILEFQVKLNLLLNQPPETVIPPPETLAEPASLPDVMLLRKKAIQTRPELRALQNRIQVGQSRLDLADKAFYPDFNLRILYNGVMDPADKRFQIGLGFNIPIRGKRHAAKDEAQAHLSQIQWQYRSEVLNVGGEVQQAYDQVIESERLLSIYRQRLLPLAEETLAAAQTDYESGHGDFLSLINAEKQLITTRLNTQRTLSDYHHRQAKLEQTIGDSMVFSQSSAGVVSHD